MEESDINTSIDISNEKENEISNNNTEKETTDENSCTSIKNTLPIWEYNPKIAVREVYKFNYEKDSFLRHCYFSPDGYFILSNDNSNTLKFYTISSILSLNYINNNHILSPPCVEPSQIKEDFKINEAGTIYDIKFNPYFNSYYPSTCYFLCTSKDHPIHLYNAYNGELLCSYCGYNNLDELTNAYSICMKDDKIYSGYKNMILMFDVTRPGKNFMKFNTCKSKKSKEGQKGILSTIDFNPEITNMFGVGSYNGSVYLYDDRSNEMINNIENIQRNGVTEVKFNHKGDMIYMGGRNNDNFIYGYDIRMINNNSLLKYERKVNTNQLFRFVISNDDKYLFSGNSDNKIRVYNTTTNNEIVNEINGFNDSVNSLDLHPYLPILLCGTGQRHYYIPNIEESDSDSDDSEEMNNYNNNYMKIMYIGVM